MRLGPKTGLAATLLVTGLALAGCGSSGDDATVSDAGSTPAAATALTITYVNGARTSTWKLSCDPPGGDHPSPAQACAALTRSAAKALPATPKSQMCTMIFGGDQTATIKGTYAGKAVDASFSRKDGCQIARWSMLQGLLPKLGANRAG